MPGISIETTCRICLSNSGVQNIYLSTKSSSASKVTFHEMMITMFSLSFNQDDGLPANICPKCSTKLSSAYKLKNLAEKSYRKLLGVFSKNLLISETENNKRVFKDEIKLEDDINSIFEDVSQSIVIKPEQLNLNNCLPDDNTQSDSHDLSYESDNDEDNKPLIFTLENINNAPQDCNKENNEIFQPKKKKSGKQTYEKKSTRRKGEKVKKEKSKTICHLCGKLVNNIVNHSATHSPGVEKRKLPCGDCPKEFVSVTARNRHRNVHHLGKLFYCNICNKEFKHQWQHVRLNHSSAPRPFGCLLCEKRFFTAGQLNYHIKFHTKEKAFQCELCGKGFRTSTDRNYHRRSVHEKERTVICQFCSKAFFSNPDLKKHLRTHSNERNHKCTLCEKAFNRVQALNQHLKIHSGIKTISCQLCSKSFYTNGNLKIHMISHTKERIHPCKYCGVKFGRPHHRDRHQKTAHENKLEA